MVAPIFAPFPAAPSRAEGRDDFSPSADTFAAALPPFALKMNLAITWMAETMTAVSASQSAAADSASAAAQSASTANTAKLAAQKAVTDASAAGAAQVQLAKDQVALSVAAKESAQAAAAAAQAAAGMPSIAGKAFMALRVNAAGTGVEWASGVPNTLVGKTGQSIMLDGGKKPYWGYAGQQIGDTLESARNPGVLYLPADGSIRSQAAYPALFSLVGLTGGSIGTNWLSVDHGNATALSAIKAVPSGTVIAVTTGNLFFRSADKGVTWAPIAVPAGSTGVSGFVTDGQGLWLTLHSTQQAYAYRSVNDGRSWELIAMPSHPAGGGAWYLGVYAGAGVIILGSTYNNYVARSTDSGATWATVMHNFSIGAIQSMSANRAGTILIASGATGGGGAGVRRSTDYGATWPTKASVVIPNVIENDGDGTWIFTTADTRTGLYKSTDDAVSFTQFTIAEGSTGLSVRYALFAYGSLWFKLSGTNTVVYSFTYSSTNTLSQVAGSNGAEGPLSDAGGGVLIAQNATAGKFSRSTPTFAYDVSTQFALPSLKARLGLNTYIKALEAA